MSCSWTCTCRTWTAIAVQRIKQIEALREIPVIFVTAVYQDDPFVRRATPSAASITSASLRPGNPPAEGRGLRGVPHQDLGCCASASSTSRNRRRCCACGRKLSSILDSLPVGILISDLDGRICQTTETVARILNQKSRSAPTRTAKCSAGGIPPAR